MVGQAGGHSPVSPAAQVGILLQKSSERRLNSSSMKRYWKRIRHRLEWLLLLLLARSVPLLWRRPFVVLANAVGDLAYAFDRRGRKLALANIQAAFGDRYALPQRAKIARAACRNFSRTMHEAVKELADRTPETTMLPSVVTAAGKVNAMRTSPNVAGVGNPP
jgi:lauroyl/myristoyl acyltransferase